MKKLDKYLEDLYYSRQDFAAYIIKTLLFTTPLAVILISLILLVYAGVVLDLVSAIIGGVMLFISATFLAAFAAYVS